ncbi:hypothetical protein, partial [Ensifer sp. BR816]|uniref:hypothetical protein n=1 Tax=Rhizobium sp. (strain BR816) TaxID=1057002 RepID=UPI001AEBF65D
VAAAKAELQRGTDPLSAEPFTAAVAFAIAVVVKFVPLAAFPLRGAHPLQQKSKRHPCFGHFSDRCCRDLLSRGQ